jgi:hypothetical protein
LLRVEADEAADLRSRSGPIEIDRRVLDRVVARTSVADLTIDGMAEAIADVLQAQRARDSRSRQPAVQAHQVEHP